MRKRVVIVGAGLAGLRGAEVLRKEGFSGSLTIIGDEPYGPYDRPPLSKRVLTGHVPVSSLGLPRRGGMEVEWCLGAGASGLDMGNRTVMLDSGGRVPFDKLLIATGAAARPWANAEEAALAGVFTLRGRDDAQALRGALAARPRRVLIIGGGFIGCEVASSCRELGLSVAVVDPSPAPMARHAGAAMGRMLARIMRTAGVELRLGARVVGLEGTAGHVRRARLSDDRALDADVVLVAMGAVREVAWLEGSGLQADPAGIRCDDFCRALDAAGRPMDGVYAAGDVALWPHPLYGGRLVSLEHWGNAVEQSRTAAHNMLSPADALVPYRYLPAFWSSQFGLNIKSIGLADGADQVAITQGDPKKSRFVAVFGGQGRTLAAFAVDSARWLSPYEGAIALRAPFPPMRRGVEGECRAPVPPEFPPARRAS